MLIYHPMALTDKGTQFVYDGMTTVAEALQQFDIWENDYGYRIREAWIDVYESGQKIKKLTVGKKWFEFEDGVIA